MFKRAAVVVAWMMFAVAARGADGVLPHRIVAGETLAAIARSYGVAVEALTAANPGIDAEHLQPGQTVTIPAPPAGWPRHRVARGETLFGISRAESVPLEDLMALNGLTGAQLEVEQDLLVPRATPRLGLPPPPPAVDNETPTATPSPTPAPLGKWIEVRLPDGRKAWAPTASMLLPSSAPLRPDGVLDIARRLFGVPYAWGGQSPNGADCSGFVQEVFRLAGYTLPRTADVQFEATVEIPQEALQPGDLVFFTTYAPGPSHVGIYSGNGHFIHASSSQGVTESSLSDTYYAKHFIGARRLREWATP